MKIALGQINPTVGDLDKNVECMAEFARRASASSADLIVFPELSVTGYPPRDLVEKPSFVQRSEQALVELARKTADLPLGIVAGYVGESSSLTGKHAANRAALVQGGQIKFRQTRRCCPHTTFLTRAGILSLPKNGNSSCFAAEDGLGNL